jgi:hypothetical protein
MQEGERQVAPTLAGIRRDHVARYQWAAARLPAGSRVVDLACGVGYGSRILAEAGHLVLGIDQDAAAIDYAWQHYSHRRANFLPGDAGALSPRPRRADFSAAVCFETIEHVADPAPLLRTLHEAAPLLIASVPNENVLPYRGYEFHHRHYTPGQFQALLNRCGWHVTEWHGQEGPESEVEPHLMGRTIIAVANRGPVIESQIHLEVKPAPAPPVVPQHVAILGLGPSLAQFVDITRRLGGRSRFCDEVWAINALGDVLACDRVFHMDDVRIQEIRAAAAPESNIAAMIAWLRKHPGPVYTSRTHADYPGLVAYPLEDVINASGFAYFNSTAAYAIAYAIHIGVKKISLFGIDFTYPNAHDAEKGRACVEFWLGLAAARKIKLSIPVHSSLMDACHSQAERLYGYDTLDVQLTPEGSRVRLDFTARKELPSADEIEDRYDHSQHPSPLVT